MAAGPAKMCARARAEAARKILDHPALVRESTVSRSSIRRRTLARSWATSRRHAALQKTAGRPVSFRVGNGERQVRQTLARLGMGFLPSLGQFNMAKYVQTCGAAL